jgi:hypothetical protein
MPQAPSSSHPFKLVYLTPLFAVLGLVSGVTFSGMLYGWHARRKLSHTANDDELEMLAHTSPSSRSGRLKLEEGYGHVHEDEAGAARKDSRHGIRPLRESHKSSPQDRLHSAISSPSDYGPTPINIHVNDGITRPWYDRLPGLSAQVSAPQAVAAPVTSNGGHLSPSWATVDLFSPASDGNGDIAARDIRSHGSIRRAIADRLGVGTRRIGSRKEGAQKISSDRGLLAVETDGVAVRRASSNQYREVGSNNLQRRPQRGISSTLESRYRKVVDEFESETSPLRFAPGSEDGQDLQRSVHAQLATSGTRVGSRSSMIALKSSRSGSNTKLRPKTRKLASPNDADNSAMSVLDSDPLPKRKIRPRSSLSPTPPVFDYEEDGENTRPTLRLLSPPPRVISPPAHPELFFADPVLGEYVKDNKTTFVSENHNRAKKHPGVTNTDVERGRPRRKLDRPKRPALSDGLGGAVSDSNGDGGGIKSAAESEGTSASVSTASAFRGRPMKPARTHEALGAVDAIMKTGWSAREDMKSAEQAEHRRKKMQQLSQAGLGHPPRDSAGREQGDVQLQRQGWREVPPSSPSITAAQRSGVVGQRIRQLLEREDAVSQTHTSG